MPGPRRENFLEAMGIQLLQGRTFRPQDDTTSPKVVVVNQTFADKFFPNQNAIGKRFTYDTSKPDELEIIGICKDAKYARQRDEAPPTVYGSYRQERPLSGATFEVRSTNALDDHFDASPALVGGEIYLRGVKYLYSIGN